VAKSKDIIYLTKEGFDSLNEELKQLREKFVQIKKQEATLPTEICSKTHGKFRLLMESTSYY